MQAKINFRSGYAGRWHQRCRWVNGDFGMLPFRGQPSGRLRLPVADDLWIVRTKRNGVMKTYFVGEATTTIGAETMGLKRD
jgi:hypothetical protein